jgi:hypothetical protein
MKCLLGLLISGALVAGSAGAAMAQTSNPDSVKESTKAVGHDTKNAAKATGKTVKKTTKKVVHKSAETTRKGASKVEDKTNPNK